MTNFFVRPKVVIATDSCDDDYTASWTVSSGASLIASDLGNFYEVKTTSDYAYVEFSNVNIVKDNRYIAGVSIKDGTKSGAKIRIRYNDGGIHTDTPTGTLLTTTGEWSNYETNDFLARATVKVGAGVYSASSLVGSSFLIKDFYVRNAYVNETGTSLTQAWCGFSNIKWGEYGASLGNSDTLYICGTHLVNNPLDVSSSGVSIRGDYASLPGVIQSGNNGININSVSNVNIGSILLEKSVGNGIYIYSDSVNMHNINMYNITLASLSDNGIKVVASGGYNITGVTISSILTNNSNILGYQVYMNSKYPSIISSILIENQKLNISGCCGIYFNSVKDAEITLFNIKDTCGSFNGNVIEICGNTANLNATWTLATNNIYSLSVATPVVKIAKIDYGSEIYFNHAATSTGLSYKSYYYNNNSNTLYVNASGNVTGSNFIIGWSVASGINIHDGYIYKTTPTQATSGYGIKLYNFVTNASLRNIMFRDVNNDIINSDICDNVYITNIISMNASGDFVKVTTSSNFNIRNCVIWNCSGAGVSASDNAIVNLYNCIIASNNIGLYDSTGYVSHDYNCFYNNTVDFSGVATKSLHEIVVNPDFIYPSIGNFHLKYNSPCICVGTTLPIGKDYDGISRVPRYDLGVYGGKQTNNSYWVQYSKGNVRISEGSKIVHGRNGANWTATFSGIHEGYLFSFTKKENVYYEIASILSATNLKLKYPVNASYHSQDYYITRSYSKYRNYSNIFRYDKCMSEVVTSQIVSKIDNDIGMYFGGTASLDTVKLIGNSNYIQFSVPASGVLEIKRDGTVIAYVATVTGSLLKY